MSLVIDLIALRTEVEDYWSFVSHDVMVCEDFKIYWGVSIRLLQVKSPLVNCLLFVCCVRCR